VAARSEDSLANGNVDKTEPAQLVIETQDSSASAEPVELLLQTQDSSASAATAETPCSQAGPGLRCGASGSASAEEDEEEPGRKPLGRSESEKDGGVLSRGELRAVRLIAESIPKVSPNVLINHRHVSTA